MKEYSKEKNDILPDINNSKKNINNSSLKIEKTKSNNISKIPSSVKKLKFKNTDVDFKNENINQKFKTKKNINSVFISERIMKEIQKEKQLTQLYDTLNNRTSNTIFPSKQITHYFNKYSKRRMPVANTDRGSNIHGLLEDVQNIINEKNFAGFAKLNNNAKKDIMIKNKNDNNNNNKELDDEYITDLDKKILGLHYDFTENLLSDKNSQLFS
jgi:hypothetical protein